MTTRPFQTAQPAGPRGGSSASASVAFLMLALTRFRLHDDPVLDHVTLFGLTSARFVTSGGPLSVERLLAYRRA